MRNLIFILTVILFSGCSHTSPYRQVKPNELIQNKYVSVIAPSVRWEITKRYEKISNASAGLPRIYKDVQGSEYEINIQTYPYNWMPIDILFDKEGEYFDSDKKIEKYSENDKEQGIKYKKGWVTYITGLKCTGGVFSRSYGGTLYSATTKNYSITCGYYDKTETKDDGKRILSVDYKYNYAFNKSRLQKDTKLKREELLTEQQAEDGLKQAVKELVKTIKIKNLDRERMEKEGLMHYDKVFESTKW